MLLVHGILDSCPIILAKGSRSGHAKFARDLCEKSYNSSRKEWYYGIKLHAVVARKPGLLPIEQWKRIQPMLPPEYTGKKGRPRKDNRTMLNGMLWMNHSGAQWRQLPERYGPWQSVYARFAKWRDEGIWEKIFSELTKDADTENLSIDSTCIKVHESSNGGKKNRR